MTENPDLEVFQQGVAAFENWHAVGYSVDVPENPYPEGTLDWNLWEDGFELAREQADFPEY